MQSIFILFQIHKIRCDVFFLLEKFTIMAIILIYCHNCKFLGGGLLNQNLDALRELFIKNKVLDIGNVMNAVDATTRMTAYKYMKRLDYLSSYTHSGRYYTLKSIPEFDKDGLWHYGDIGFSRYGTLMETIIHLVNNSKNGKTNSELEKQQRIYVQNALLSLVKAKKIRREERNGVYVYVSPDLEISSTQMRRRHEIGSTKRLPDWIVAEILIEVIKSLMEKPCIDEVVMRLSSRGSLISREQVEQVFEENDLEKKTLD